MECDICKLINSIQPGKLIILETSKWEVVLSPNQQNLGKCWITLINHKSKLSELDDIEWADFTTIVKKLESNCQMAFSPHHFNWHAL